MRRPSPVFLAVLPALLAVGCSRCAKEPAPPVPLLVATPDGGVTVDGGVSFDAGVPLDAGIADAGMADVGDAGPIASGETTGAAALLGEFDTGVAGFRWRVERRACGDETCPVDLVLIGNTSEAGRVTCGLAQKGRITACRDAKGCWTLGENAEEEDAPWTSLRIFPARWWPGSVGLLCFIEGEESTGDAIPQPDYVAVGLVDGKPAALWTRKAADFPSQIIGAHTQEAPGELTELVFTRQPQPEEGEETSATAVSLFGGEEHRLVERKPLFALTVEGKTAACPWSSVLLRLDGTAIEGLPKSHVLGLVTPHREQAEAWKKERAKCAPGGSDIVELR